MILPRYFPPIIRSYRVRLAHLLVPAAAILFSPVPKAHADATDISLLFVTKTVLYSQNSPADPAVQPNGFTFDAGAIAVAPGRILSAQFTPPKRSTRTMTNV